MERTGVLRVVSGDECEDETRGFSRSAWRDEKHGHGSVCLLSWIGSISTRIPPFELLLALHAWASASTMP